MNYLELMVSAKLFLLLFVAMHLKSQMDENQEDTGVIFKAQVGGVWCI